MTAAAAELRARAPDFAGRILVGSEGPLAVATHPEADIVLSALVGALGLEPTLAAVHAGKDVALANKEVLVVAGELVTRAARERGVRLLPVDSEHNAIFQALHGQNRAEVRRIVLTASGGPFLAPLARRARARHDRRRAQAPHLEDGTEDHDRLVDAHEQGARGDRGALAVRRRGGTHRRRDPPAEHHPLDGRVRRRLGAGADGRARHDDPDRLRARLSRAPAARLSAPSRSAGRRRAHLRGAGSRTLPVSRRSPTGRSAPAARCRRS